MSGETERFVVQITDSALNDMEELYRYIAEKLESPQNAAGQYDRIADEILSLDIEPERAAGLRRMLVDNYSVFYVIRDDKVIVTDVLYSASDIEQRLKEKHQ